MRYVIWGIFWSCIYMILIVTPQIVLLAGDHPSGNGFFWDFSLALGFAATSMMAVMFFLTSRFKLVMLPFGIDLIYYFHRLISIFAAFLVLAHPAIIIVLEPGLLKDLTGDGYFSPMMAGVYSFFCMGGIMLSSLFRKQLGLHYDLWRLIHLVLAIFALCFAIFHIEGIEGYISHPVKKVLWGGIMVSWLLTAVYVRLIKPWVLLTKPWVVSNVRAEKGSSYTLEVQPQGHEGMKFQPGQFAWLTLYSSPFRMNEHPFSISSSAEKSGVISFTIKELGDFTAKIKNVAIGEKAYIDGPYGSFSIDRHQTPEGFVFVAGGIGIAPVMGMLRTLEDRGDTRKHVVIYGYSSLERMTFYEELRRMEKSLNLTAVFVLDQPPADWEGERGVITEELFRRNLSNDELQKHYFICGPKKMLQVVEKSLHRIGVPLHHLHSELFDLV